jgi:dolichol-phosphate mannosyltransferase
MENHEEGQKSFSGAEQEEGASGPRPLRLLSVVIPARDEEGCIGSTVEHLYVELRLRNVPHEIVVVDDGSSDRTWQVLQEAQERVPRSCRSRA